MKQRNGFVSNSSSASFVVSKHSITYAQGAALLAYHTHEDNVDGWAVREEGEYIRGHTIMDNDAIDAYLTTINFPINQMVWDSN